MKPIHLKNIRRLFLSAGCILAMGLGLQSTYAQVMNNHGAGIYISGGGTATLHVDGDFVNENGGTLDNSGQIQLTGDWTNNAGNSAFINSSPGEVQLTGTTQTLSGSSVTLFNDLTLVGSGVRSMGQDIRVEGVLDLDNGELASDTQTVFIENPAISALVHTSGFVSSQGNGGLSRETNSTMVYDYFVGSSVGNSRYRPITIQPGSPSANTYKVRFANVDPGTEGYPTVVKEDLLCAGNDQWYHRINQTAGNSPADITIFFDSLSDGKFDAMAHWQTQPRWESVGSVTIAYLGSPSLSSMKVIGWNDFSYDPFALGVLSPTASFSCDSSMTPTISFFGTAAGNVTSWDWSFGDGNTSALQNPTHTYTTDSLYTVTLITGNNCGSDTISKPLLIRITNIDAQTPEAFISLFPNPNNGEFQVEFNGVQAANGMIEVFDMAGKRIHEVDLGSLSQVFRQSVDLSGYTNGSYLVKITLDEQVITRRVIKQ